MLLGNRESRLVSCFTAISLVFLRKFVAYNKIKK